LPPRGVKKIAPGAGNPDLGVRGAAPRGIKIIQIIY